MDLTLLGLWYVCGLGATIFASLAPLRWVTGSVFVVTFAAMTWWVGPGLVPDVTVIALVTGLAATLQLIRPPSPMLSAVVAGTLAGTWTAVLEIQGVPSVLSPFVAGLLPAASFVLRTRRSSFAPTVLRDEALLFMCVLGIVAAAVPGVVEGWRAALTLNLQDGAPPAMMVPAWALTLTVMAGMAGGLYTLWSRR